MSLKVAPATSSRPGPKQATKGTGVAALFQESMDVDAKRQANPTACLWAKPSVEAIQSQRRADELVAQDPTIFQYDEVLDEVHKSADTAASARGGQKIRLDGLEQKKRVGLTLSAGADKVKTGVKRDSRYIEKVLVATDRRKAEQQIIEDRLLQKEKLQNEGSEVFVTAGFKEELKRRKRFEQELAEQEVRDDAKAAEKQENGLGFASMYRNLLDRGLATSRGSETLVERQAPRIDLEEGEREKERITHVSEEMKAASSKQAPLKEEADGELKDEPMDEPMSEPMSEPMGEPKKELKEESKEEPKEEPKEKEGSTEQDCSGVATAKVVPPASTKKAKEMETQVQRTEKMLSAKERYLLRKQQQAAA